MRFRKTPQSARTVYVYETVNEKGVRKTIDTITPGKDGVTEVDVKHLHYIEDYETECNIASLHFMTPAQLKRERRQWKQEFTQKFKAENGREPYLEELKKAQETEFKPYCFLSIESIEEDLGDKSSILAVESRISDFDTRYAIKEKIDSLVRNLSDKELQIFNLYFLLEEKNKTRVAEAVGVSDTYVRKVIKKIRAIFEADEFLKDFYLASSDLPRNHRLHTQEDTK